MQATLGVDDQLQAATNKVRNVLKGLSWRAEDDVHTDDFKRKFGEASLRYKTYVGEWRKAGRSIKAYIQTYAAKAEERRMKMTSAVLGAVEVHAAAGMLEA